MITKSMSRKSASFSQLYDYLMRDDVQEYFSHNLYSSITNKKAFLQEFYDNAEFLQNSRGSNILYHEILSLPKNELSKQREKEILLNLAHHYIELRANNHLTMAVMHDDKEHLHVHLMISANEIESHTRKRLSKAQFASMQKMMEDYKNQTYPEIQSTLYQQEKQPQNSKRQEQEMKQHKGKKSQKERLTESLRHIMKHSHDKRQFESALKENGYSFYARGKTIGISHNGVKYRFKTLGLLESYEVMLKHFEYQKEAQKQREAKRQKVKESKKRRHYEYEREDESFES